MQHWLPVSFLPRSCEKTNTESFIIVQSHFHTLNIRMSMHWSIKRVICLNETFNHHQPVSRLSGWLSEWVRRVRVSLTTNQSKLSMNPSVLSICESHKEQKQWKQPTLIDKLMHLAFSLKNEWHQMKQFVVNWSITKHPTQHSKHHTNPDDH